MNELNTENALKIYKKLPLKFLGFKENPMIEELFPSIGSVVGENINIFGIASGNPGKLTAVFASDNQTKYEIPVDFSTSSTVEKWQIAQFWAQRKINELELNSTKNRNEIRNISEQFGVVSKNTSLLF